MKHFLTIFIVALTLLLTACGNEKADIKDIAEQETPSNTETNSNNETDSEDETAMNNSNTEVDESNVDEDNDLRVENTYTDKELAINGEVGPMLYNITAIQLKKITVKSESMAELFEVNVGDEVHGISISLDGENTSDEDMSFYLGQATIITNTKEQLEPDIWLSEHIEGDYLGKVSHEGYNFYLLKKSTVDELSTIEIRISAPTDSNYESIGSDIKHIIEVNK